MSKYTTEVRFICETKAGLLESKGFNNVNDIITLARPNIFTFSYPIFDDNYKPTLETKILKHYYTREIGFETVGLWLLNLDRKLNEIMPYYNQLYASELLMNGINPLHDIDYTKEHEGEAEDLSTGTIGDSGTQVRSVTDTHSNQRTLNTTKTDDTTEKFSDTPQGALTGLSSDNYLTSAKMTHATMTEGGTITDAYNGSISGRDTNTNTRTLNTALNNTNSYLEHIVGKSAGTSYAKLLDELRKTFLNIDMQIIKDLDILFMGLW